jgi:hypothetical protein
LEDPAIDEKLISKWTLVDWIHNAQDRDHWQNPENTEMKVQAL